MTEEREKKFVEVIIKEAKVVQPCLCQTNRWKTLEKGKKWKCRNCGRVREV